MNTPRRTRPRRRGNITLETILAIPILAIVTFAIVQFGILVVVMQTVTQAAVEGARRAAMEGNPAAASTAAIEAANQVLALHDLEIVNGDPTSDTRIVVEYAGAAPVISGDPGLACSTPLPAVLNPSEVRVTVCVDLTTAPLLSLSLPFGLNLFGRRFEISSMATIE